MSSLQLESFLLAAEYGKVKSELQTKTKALAKNTLILRRQTSSHVSLAESSERKNRRQKHVLRALSETSMRESLLQRCDCNPAGCCLSNLSASDLLKPRSDYWLREWHDQYVLTFSLASSRLLICVFASQKCRKSFIVDHILKQKITRDFPPDSPRCFPFAGVLLCKRGIQLAYGLSDYLVRCISMTRLPKYRY